MSEVIVASSNPPGTKDIFFFSANNSLKFSGFTAVVEFHYKTVLKKGINLAINLEPAKYDL